MPLGRHQIRFTFIGYKPLVQTIVVNSGKSSTQREIEESMELLEEFEITSNENEVNNEMAIISAQQFSVENRAICRVEVIQLEWCLTLLAYKVLMTENDIIVRGNSPLGVIYRRGELPFPTKPFCYFWFIWWPTKYS